LFPCLLEKPDASMELAQLLDPLDRVEGSLEEDLEDIQERIDTCTAW
jgi:hypothetical protein